MGLGNTELSILGLIALVVTGMLLLMRSGNRERHCKGLDVVPEGSVEIAPLGSSISCKQCGGEMKKTSKSESSMAVQLFGVIVFILGLASIFLLFPLGIVIGPLMMLCALFMGHKKRKVWKCMQCGYFFERA